MKSRLSQWLIGALLFSCVNHDLEHLSDPCLSTDLALSVTETTNASTCTSADGSITVLPSGGASPYQFSINSGSYSENNTFENLKTGSYTIDVKDGNGCVASVIGSVNNAQSNLQFSIATTDNTGCPTANGSITISVSGGTAPFTFQLNAGNFQSENTFASLAAGSYSVTVKDASGCPTNGSATVSRQGPSFSDDIQPIITAKCAISGCHKNAEAPILTTYTNIHSFASNIKAEVSSRAMPPSDSPAGALTQQQINLITCWINDGAANN